MAGKRGGDRWPVALGPTHASDVHRLRLIIDVNSEFLAGATAWEPQVHVAKG